MPMVLRSRRSIQPRKASEVQPLETPRRSTRLLGRATYEDSEESDSESVQSRSVMEAQPGAPAWLEGEEGDEQAGDLKSCRVVLDRLHVEDKPDKKEAEEKEDMSRRGGKSTSRIPTFHKRPIAQASELPGSRREPSALLTQPHEKAGGLALDASKSKPPEVRETALPQLSTRGSKVTSEDPPVPSGLEHAAAGIHGSLIAAPRSYNMSEAMPSPLMTVSARPPLIRDKWSEGDVAPEDLGSCPPCQESLSPKTSKMDEDAPESSASSSILENTSKTPTVPTAEDEDEEEEVEEEEEEEEVEAIMDEEPPWETESMKAADLRVSRSSSEAECEEDLAEEEVEEQLQEPQNSQFTKNINKKSVDRDELNSTVAAKKAEKITSAKSHKPSGCSSFAAFCLFPATLLLLGGFGLHVWQYGVPMSVAQLAAQLELHWLEGISLIPKPCSSDCRVDLVESIPVGLFQSSPRPGRSIADSWLSLLRQANSSVDIAAFYFTLRDSDTDLSGSADSLGREVFEQLKLLPSRGVKLRIAVNSPQESIRDTGELAAAGAEVREVELQAVTGGIVHTKLLVVDQQHVYLGSANMDWRSLSEVKEVGLSVEDCSCLARDAARIFGVYWSLGGGNHTSLPPYWPARLSALSSSQNPLHLKFNGIPTRVYLSSAPPQLSARGRSDDLSTILSIIEDAQNFIYISVMDYLPMSQFAQPVRFWPAIDSALRAAACTRGVHVRLMVSCWTHSPGAMFTFLQALLVLNRPPLECDVSVKVFTVPSTAEQKKIPFARVNHAKYMVTDRALYIGTSNWSEGYFTQTAGVGVVVNQTGSAVGPGQQSLQSQAEDLFLRDWSSPYSSPLSVDDPRPCPQ